MRLLFLIPLTTGIIFSYLAYTTSEDITYLTGVLAAFSLLLSLILAPWQLQLVLLLLILLSATQFWRRFSNQGEVEIEEQSANNKTQQPQKTINEPIPAANPSTLRKYRGITYDSEIKDHSQQPDEQELNGKYRGVSVKIQHSPQTPTLNNSKLELKYRGASVISDKDQGS